MHLMKVPPIFTAICCVIIFSCSDSEPEPVQVANVDSTCIKLVDSLKDIIQDREAEISLYRNGGVKADEYWTDSLLDNPPPYKPDSSSN